MTQESVNYSDAPVFDRYGAGALLATAGVMALANSAFALTVPKPATRN